MMIVVPKTGDPVSCDISVLTVPQVGGAPAKEYVKFTLETSFDLPVSLYAVGLTTDEISHTITASAGDNGTIAPSGDVSVIEGASKDFNNG